MIEVTTENSGDKTMKIKEILTKEEYDSCISKLPFGYMVNEERIDMKLSNHVPEMELDEYLKYRILDTLNFIAANTLPEEYR